MNLIVQVKLHNQIVVEIAKTGVGSAEALRIALMTKTMLDGNPIRNTFYDENYQIVEQKTTGRPEVSDIRLRLALCYQDLGGGTNQNLKVKDADGNLLYDLKESTNADVGVVAITDKGMKKLEDDYSEYKTIVLDLDKEVVEDHFLGPVDIDHKLDHDMGFDYDRLPFSLAPHAIKNLDDLQRMGYTTFLNKDGSYRGIIPEPKK